MRMPHGRLAARVVLRKVPEEQNNKQGFESSLWILLLPGLRPFVFMLFAAEFGYERLLKLLTFSLHSLPLGTSKDM